MAGRPRRQSARGEPRVAGQVIDGGDRAGRVVVDLVAAVAVALLARGGGGTGAA